jgi:hypothetical protein
MHICLSPAGGSSEGLEVVCQLTQLERLDLIDYSETFYSEGRFLQLTQLRQLKCLDYSGCAGSVTVKLKCKCEVSWLSCRQGASKSGRWCCCVPMQAEHVLVKTMQEHMLLVPFALRKAVLLYTGNQLCTKCGWK